MERTAHTENTTLLFGLRTYMHFTMYCVPPDNGKGNVFSRHSRSASPLTGVVDDVVLDVVRQSLAGVDPLLQLGVGDVSRDHDGARQAQPRPHRVTAEELADLVHGLVQVYLDHLPIQYG